MTSTGQFTGLLAFTFGLVATFGLAISGTYAQADRTKTPLTPAEEAKRKEIIALEEAKKEAAEKEAAAKEEAEKEAAARSASAVNAASADRRSSAGPARSPNTKFRVGEKFSYNLSFGPSDNAGIAEIGVASSGKLDGRDAIELRANIKTVELVSAAFFKIDQNRTTFVDAATGMPLYTTRVDRTGPLPVPTSANFLKTPSNDHDLLSLIFALRNSGGAGSFTLREGAATHSVIVQNVGSMRSWTPLGVFETVVSRIESDLLALWGLNDLAIHFSADDRMIPVLIRVRTDRGLFRAVLASITEPVIAAEASPTPVLRPAATPTPRPTPPPVNYVPDQPLLPELGFELGEALDYRVFYGGRPAGVIRLAAERRELIDNTDSLVLRASVVAAEQGNPGLRAGDGALAVVDPDTLATRRIESRFDSQFSALNQSVFFDPAAGKATFSNRSVDIPLGTHSFLSLLYAIRSFNLRPSRDAANPVNDTRVAVFWGDRAHVFTLRPSAPEVITINGERIPAQLISFQTGIPQLDAMQIKIWVAARSRVPLRYIAGQYQADIAANPPTKD